MNLGRDGVGAAAAARLEAREPRVAPRRGVRLRVRKGFEGFKGLEGVGRFEGF